MKASTELTRECLFSQTGADKPMSGYVWGPVRHALCVGRGPLRLILSSPGGRARVRHAQFHHKNRQISKLNEKMGDNLRANKNCSIHLDARGLASCSSPATHGGCLCLLSTMETRVAVILQAYTLSAVTRYWGGNLYLSPEPIIMYHTSMDDGFEQLRRTCLACCLASSPDVGHLGRRLLWKNRQPHTWPVASRAIRMRGIWAVGCFGKAGEDGNLEPSR